jgi:hypothetical protein
LCCGGIKSKKASTNSGAPEVKIRARSAPIGGTAILPKEHEHKLPNLRHIVARLRGGHTRARWLEAKLSWTGSSTTTTQSSAYYPGRPALNTGPSWDGGLVRMIEQHTPVKDSTLGMTEAETTRLIALASQAYELAQYWREGSITAREYVELLNQLRNEYGLWPLPLQPSFARHLRINPVQIRLRLLSFPHHGVQQVLWSGVLGHMNRSNNGFLLVTVFGH